MIDIKKWAEKAPIATWTVFLYTVLAAIFGTAKASYELYQDVHDHFNPKVVTAVLTFGDFQMPRFDILTVTFDNPTDKTQTIDNVGFLCRKVAGNPVEIMPANDNPLPVIDPQGLVVTPLAVFAGAPLKVTFLIHKDPNHPINKECTSIQTWWTDADMKARAGMVYSLGTNTATFSNMVLNKG